MLSLRVSANGFVDVLLVVLLIFGVKAAVSSSLSCPPLMTAALLRKTLFTMRGKMAVRLGSGGDPPTAAIFCLRL